MTQASADEAARRDGSGLERGVRPVAWMAQHGRQPVQATVSPQQADAWAQAGGDVVELYDGVTFWNAIASTDERRRELQAQIEQLQDRLARAGLEQQRAVRDERERWRELVEQLIACHEEPTCPAVTLAREWLDGPNAKLTCPPRAGHRSNDER